MYGDLGAFMAVCFVELVMNFYCVEIFALANEEYLCRVIEKYTKTLYPIDDEKKATWESWWQCWLHSIAGCGLDNMYR